MREREIVGFHFSFYLFWSYFLEYFSSLFYFTQGYVSTFYLLGDWLIIDFSKGGEGRIFFRFSKGREIVHLVYRN